MRTLGLTEAAPELESFSVKAIRNQSVWGNYERNTLLLVTKFFRLILNNALAVFRGELILYDAYNLDL